GAVVLVDHDVEPDLVAQRELVEIAVEETVSDLRIKVAVRQHYPQRAALQSLLPSRVVSHFREVPDAHGLSPLTILFDKSRNPLDAGFRLFPKGKMTGLRNDLEPRAGYSSTPAFAVGGGHDAVLRAPQKHGRTIDPMQPAFEPRVVHVGLPAVKREGFTSPDDRRQLALRQPREID